MNGPTAVVTSTGKIDNVEILGGIAFNLRIEPAVFRGGDVKRMADLVRTFVGQKIFHMQINVVSSDTLRAAQKEPDKYNGLGGEGGRLQCLLHATVLGASGQHHCQDRARIADDQSQGG